MKILQILPQLNFGGVEVGTVDLAGALMERGHKAYVISAGGALVGNLVRMGVTHYTLPVHKKSLQALFMIHKVREIIEREGIDIVHARSRVPAWIAYFATRRTRAKFITTCHGFYSKHAMSRIMGWGDRVIVISRAVGRRMIDDFGVSPERISLIHRGVDLSRCTFDLTRFDPKVREQKEKFIVANVGRLTPIKGHEYFIKAIHLASHHYSHIEAWIVGGCPKRKMKYLAELKELVEKLGLSTTVHFLGVEKDVPTLLKQVDLLVLSTTYPEGFGRVVVEAGASGVPVVATKVGGVPDIIDDEKNGLLVPPQDEVKMSEAIMRIINEPTRAKTMATNLRKKVEKQFSAKKMIDETIEVYQSVQKQKRILVIKLGAIGDIILAIPSLRMIRKRFSNAYIAVLVDAELTASLEYCPYIDEIIPFKRKDKKNRLRHMKKLVLKLRKSAFDMSVDFQNNTRTHLIAFLAGIPQRYGYTRGVMGKLLTNGVGSFRDSLPPVQHQFRVLNLLGISECDEHLEMWPSPDDREYIRHILDEWGCAKGQKKVGFVLSASKRWQTKKWPLSHFVELANRLIQSCGCRIVLIGDMSAKEDSERFLAQRRSEVLDMVGKTSISQLAALMESLDCLVSGDTAPLHVASAMKTNIVALFGPTDPRRHMPPGGKNKVLRKTLACSPCYKETCARVRCMQDISVDEVFEAVRYRLVR